ncbi:MAG: histidine phosphatase family protein [Deltaproteobacteria bacterium]|nr:histidine phosphatase family protein [Deltaproteobacteria bacterium]
MDYTRLYLIRHGQVEGHDLWRFSGHTDVDLTPLGRAQLAAVADGLADETLDAVYASDLKRARYGGELLVRSRNLELKISPGLREHNFGRWEGLTFEEIKELYPEEVRLSREDFVKFRFPGGESRDEFWERIKAANEELLNSHRGQTVAVVAHSGVNRVMLLQAMKAKPESLFSIAQDYACLNIVDYYPNGLSIVRLVNHPHSLQGGEG